MNTTNQVARLIHGIVMHGGDMDELLGLARLLRIAVSDGEQTPDAEGLRMIAVSLEKVIEDFCV